MARQIFFFWNLINYSFFRVPYELLNAPHNLVKFIEKQNTIELNQMDVLYVHIHHNNFFVFDIGPYACGNFAFRISKPALGKQ
jgi:hypothetical protein